ncbi:MAG: AraC family transcriptional regulator [Acidobacteriaceae bacterium]
MDDQEIHIVTLPPMKVARFYAYSSSPEHDAWNKMMSWAKSHDYWKEVPLTRIFGFDNPSPTEGSPNRGYEFWITVGPEVQSDKEVKVQVFTGGKYAVLRCNVTGNPFEVIPAGWETLIKWCEASQYTYGNHQCVEEHLTRPEDDRDYFVLDLCLPITDD